MTFFNAFLEENVITIKRHTTNLYKFRSPNTNNIDSLSPVQT